MIEAFHRLRYNLGFAGAGYYAAVRIKQPTPSLQPPVVRLGDVSYAALAYNLPELQDCELNDLLPDEYRPVVVVSVDENSSHSTLLNWVNSLEPTQDDVFSRDFLTDTVIVQGSRHDVQRLRKSWPTSSPWHPSHILFVPTPKQLLPSGPYFLGAGLQLYQAWRLYPDKQGSFATPLLPTTVGAELSSYDFRPLEVRLDGLWNAVAVPSRLYSERSQSKPLAGLRFSIKDNFKLSGTVSTQSNRAWCELYGGNPENETAAYVKTMVDLGAVFVGKTLMCAFASSEEATDQWIDFHAPFNPRGDGYQSPSGSTTGGATSLAAYDWLDYSLGTDTTGSIRWPAAWCGLFGLRTSWQEELMRGVYPACKFMDTVGILSRSIEGIQMLVEQTISTAQVDTAKASRPTEILYPEDFFPMENQEQQGLVERFIGDLESSIGIKATKISISERWRVSPPQEAGGRSIQEFLDKVAYNPFYYDGYHEYEDFRKQYEDKFGKPAYVGPYMRWKWDRGSEVTEEMKSKSMEGVEIYRRWFEQNILHSTPNGGTSAIMLIPCGSSRPKYRDEANRAPAPVGAFTWNYIASVQGLPQLVIPIGHISYDSRISKREEQLPVVGSIVGAPGSDLLLTDLGRHALEKAGRPMTVLTGRNMFSVDVKA